MTDLSGFFLTESFFSRNARSTRKLFIASDKCHSVFVFFWIIRSASLDWMFRNCFFCFMVAKVVIFFCLCKWGMERKTTLGLWGECGCYCIAMRMQSKMMFRMMSERSR